MKLKSFLKNFCFSLSSNILSFAISAIIVLIVPKLIGVAEYGYYQLYVFYAGYTGFFHFGWCDGIYLKYGGIEYQNYNRPLMSAQFWYMFIAELIITLGLITGIILLAPGVEKQFVLGITAVSIIFVIPKTLLAYLLQISNRIKEYSLVVIVEKAAYFLVTIVMLLGGVRTYRPLIIADLIGKFCALILAGIFCKDIVFARPEKFHKAIAEAWEDIRMGIKLMFANIASMLILGIVRMSIENKWNIEMYAKVSLAISISNMLMVFINAVGIVIFPLLRRMEEGKLPELYLRIRDILMLILFAMLFVYYPVQWVLMKWLPAYVESFKFMSILFPLCIYESKMAMLVNTYLKALRRERQLLFVNVLTVGISLISSYICVYVFESISLTMVLVVILFAFRCIVCEMILAKMLELALRKDSVAEILMCVIFMFTSTNFQAAIAILLYGVAYCGYIAYKRNSILALKNAIMKLRLQ